MLATLAVRLQSLQVGDVLKLALLAWSRTLDLKGAVFSGVFVSLPSTCIDEGAEEGGKRGERETDSDRQRGPETDRHQTDGEQMKGVKGER